MIVTLGWPAVGQRRRRISGWSVGSTVAAGARRSSAAATDSSSTEGVAVGSASGGADHSTSGFFTVNGAYTQIAHASQKRCMPSGTACSATWQDEKSST